MNATNTMNEYTPSATFTEFKEKYCQDDSSALTEIDNQTVEATNLLLYGQLTIDRRILIVRSGLHNGRIFHWMATFDATKNEEVLYQPVTEVTSGRETTDHRIAAVHGMNAATLSFEDVKALDGRHIASIHMSSNAIKWHDDGGEQSVDTPPFYTTSVE